MSLIELSRLWIRKVLFGHYLEEPKALLLDEITLRFVSLSMSRSQLIEDKVLIIETLESLKYEEDSPILPAIVFITNDDKSINLLKRQLEDPIFPSYIIFFTTIVPHYTLEIIAQSDVNSRIQHISSIQTQYFPMSPTSFLTPNYSSIQNQYESLSLCSFISNFNTMPQIMCTKGDNYLGKLGDKILQHFQALNNKNITNDSILYLVDRDIDPITPCILHWTYEALLHEIFGIDGNKIDFKQYNRRVKGFKPQGNLKYFILDPEGDDFFQENREVDYSVLMQAFHQRVTEFNEFKQKVNNQEDSLEKLRSLLDTVDDVKHESAIISRHLIMIKDINATVDNEHLIDCAELQHELLTTNNITLDNVLESYIIPVETMSLNENRKVLMYLLLLNKLGSSVKTLFDQDLLIKYEDVFTNYMFLLTNAYGTKEESNNWLTDFITAKINQAKDEFSNTELFNFWKPNIIRFLERKLKNSDPKASDPHFTRKGPDFSRSNLKRIFIYVKNGVFLQEIHAINKLSQEFNLPIYIGSDNMLNSNEFIKMLKN
eukprot:TRINITY_DN2021_c1_g1_i1.p1 TRINITY_DN2021_c1_g1~~TRINITY_DN2021_c1_g1_i1.p1  ORF type:complete len:544 (-),score=101.03 TRINITY_DN2021_c1_g1_i1:71-1702(-)